MKRDMDLVRSTLLEIEGGKRKFDTSELTETGDDYLEPEASQRRTLDHHLRIMAQAGLIDLETDTFDAVVNGLTWEGHDFLDTVRDPEVWKRTKDGASKMGGWTFGLLKDLGTAYLKHVAKERLGLDL